MILLSTKTRAQYQVVTYRAPFLAFVQCYADVLLCATSGLTSVRHYCCYIIPNHCNFLYFQESYCAPWTLLAASPLHQSVDQSSVASREHHLRITFADPNLNALYPYQVSFSHFIYFFSFIEILKYILLWNPIVLIWTYHSCSKQGLHRSQKLVKFSRHLHHETPLPPNEKQFHDCHPSHR